MTGFGAMVKKYDPDRFIAAMTAPESARPKLLLLYAFNLEIARAPWMSAEPMVAEIRLQWWRDALDGIYAGQKAGGHEILLPLGEIIDLHDLPQASFMRMIEARRFDIYREAHKDRAAFDDYIDATSSELLVLASIILGGADSVALRRVGFAVGVANLLRAAPELWARGCAPLPSELLPILRDALSRLDTKAPGRSFPAVLAGWRARATLKTALRDEDRIRRGELEESPAWRAFSFWLCRITKRI